ncbi:AAA family ATPase [Pararhodobacter sp.]|uniref:AAA family ATPase n=1 Tax=Pararhodobacter sp. TaxID=2127056 RepID=UPI002AFEA4BF|nr:AAA family ATPase [Pararhodobacter sp.]
MNARLFVLTGGPGSGKTTLLAALAEAGLATMPEAGRAIIRDQIRIGGTGWHGQDRRLFAELMLGWEMRSWQAAQAVEGPVFFDRGIPDVIGYLSLYEGHVPVHVTRAARLYRYHPTVLLAPPWAEIFEQDEDRGQDFDEAVATAQAMEQAYAEAGYDLLPLPLAPVAERVDFVLDLLDRSA